MRRAARLGSPLWLGAVLLAYGAVLLFRLDRVPLMNPDEAAYTEPAWTLLTQGRFGAPMYAGMLAIDQRWYFLWPGYAVLGAIPYALAGAQVPAVRLLSGAFGAVMLCAVWWLGRQVTGTSRAWGASGLAVGAVCLAALHPTLFYLSRFGRPEIGVTAFSLLASALGAYAWASPGRRRWHAAAGAAAGLSFLMHQYGGFAIAVLGAAYILRSPGALRRDASKLGWMALGLTLALLPWLAWVASDSREFWAQLSVQLAYQRYRYPGAGALQMVLFDPVARYVLGAQDFPSDWRPWDLALANLLGADATRPLPLAPTALLRALGRMTLNALFLPPSILARWAALGALALGLLGTAGAVLATARRSGDAMAPMLSVALRWVLLPLAIWAVGLAPIPNKWDGYTGSVAAYSAIALAALPWLLLECRTLMASSARLRRALAAVAGLFAVVCGVTWLASDVSVLRNPATPYAVFGARVQALVPPGEPVASSMREWFAFAGRNPTVTYEFRSVPAFNNSVLEMMRTQRPRYLALHRVPGATSGGTAGGAASGGARRYYFIDPATSADFYAYLDRATTLVGEVSDPSFGTVEVRRVLEWP